MKVWFGRRPITSLVFFGQKSIMSHESIMISWYDLISFSELIKNKMKFSHNSLNIAEIVICRKLLICISFYYICQYCWCIAYQLENMSILTALLLTKLLKRNEMTNHRDHYYWNCDLSVDCIKAITYHDRKIRNNASNLWFWPILTMKLIMYQHTLMVKKSFQLTFFDWIWQW